MVELIELWFKCLSKPVTRRRLIVFFFGAALVISLFLFYERYTLSYRLGRLQKEADLIEQLQKIEAEQSTNGSPELERARKTLLGQTLEAIEAKPVAVAVTPLTLRFSMDNLWKFLAGGFGWILAAIFPLERWKSAKDKKEVLGKVGVAFIAGFLAMFVPAIWWPWFHILIYPLLLTLAVFVAISPFALYVAFKRAKHRTQAIRCSNNLKHVGIASLIWAGSHEGVLPGDLDSIKADLGNENLLCCAADKTKKFELLSPSISVVDPSVVYVRCPFHDFVLLADGSVQPIGKRQLVRKNGKWIIRSSDKPLS